MERMKDSGGAKVQGERARPNTGSVDSSLPTKDDSSSAGITTGAGVSKSATPNSIVGGLPHLALSLGLDSPRTKSRSNSSETPIFVGREALPPGISETPVDDADYVMVPLTQFVYVRRDALNSSEVDRSNNTTGLHIVKGNTSPHSTDYFLVDENTPGLPKVSRLQDGNYSLRDPGKKQRAMLRTMSVPKMDQTSVSPREVEDFLEIFGGASPVPRSVLRGSMSKTRSVPDFSLPEHFGKKEFEAKKVSLSDEEGKVKEEQEQKHKHGKERHHHHKRKKPKTPKRGSKKEEGGEHVNEEEPDQEAVAPLGIQIKIKTSGGTVTTTKKKSARRKPGSIGRHHHKKKKRKSKDNAHWKNTSSPDLQEGREEGEEGPEDADVGVRSHSDGSSIVVDSAEAAMAAAGSADNNALIRMLVHLNSQPDGEHVGPTATPGIYETLGGEYPEQRAEEEVTTPKKGKSAFSPRKKKASKKDKKKKTKGGSNSRLIEDDMQENGSIKKKGKTKQIKKEPSFEMGSPRNADIYDEGLLTHANLEQKKEKDREHVEKVSRGTTKRKKKTSRKGKSSHKRRTQDPGEVAEKAMIVAGGYSSAPSSPHRVEADRPAGSKEKHGKNSKGKEKEDDGEDDDGDEGEHAGGKGEFTLTLTGDEGDGDEGNEKFSHKHSQEVAVTKKPRKRSPSKKPVMSPTSASNPSTYLSPPPSTHHHQFLSPLSAQQSPASRFSPNSSATKLNEGVAEVGHWLHDLRLPEGEYLPMLCADGFDDLETIKLITEEELKELGITKTGHRKRIMLWVEQQHALSQSAPQDLGYARTPTQLGPSAASALLPGSSNKTPASPAMAVPEREEERKGAVPHNNPKLATDSDGRTTPRRLEGEAAPSALATTPKSPENAPSRRPKQRAVSFHYEKSPLNLDEDDAQSALEAEAAELRAGEALNSPMPPTPTKVKKARRMSWGATTRGFSNTVDSPNSARDSPSLSPAYASLLPYLPFGTPADLSTLVSLDISRKDLTRVPQQVWELTQLEQLYLYLNKLDMFPPEIRKMKNLTALGANENMLRALPVEIGSLTALTVLDLRHNRLTALPKSIKKMTSLSKLFLRFNKLESLPEEIGCLKSLEVLSVRNNTLVTLPKQINQATSLKILDVSSNSLSKFGPASVGNLKLLKNLDLKLNRLTSLPTLGWKNLSNLRKLDLSQNRFVLFPVAIADIPNLDTLDMEGNQLVKLPPAIGKMTSLSTLYLGRNQLAFLPPEIGNLVGLKELYFKENKLTTIPFEMHKLTSLRHLDLSTNNFDSFPPAKNFPPVLSILNLSDNQITKLPEQISELNTLKQLNLQENTLEIIPTEISMLTSLAELRLAYNELAVLPDAIGYLPAIKQLFLEHNRLVELPATLGNLGSLELLVLTDNSLVDLPNEMKYMSSLTELKVDNNPFTKLPPHIIGAGGRDTYNFIIKRASQAQKQGRKKKSKARE